MHICPIGFMSGEKASSAISIFFVFLGCWCHCLIFYTVLYIPKLKTTSFECPLNVVVCQGWLHPCNLSSIIRCCIVWLINDRKFCSVHTESGLGQLIPVRMNSGIQKGRRFLGVARGFDQEQTYYFLKLKKSCWCQDVSGRETTAVFRLVFLIQEISLFPVGISFLPSLRPGKQMNAFGCFICRCLLC